MAKPRPKPQLSLRSAYLQDEGGGIGPGHWSRRFFERIYGAFDDAQFADLYEEGRRYPISPGLLACVTIRQYVFRVSDQVAVDDSVMRRD